MMKAVEEQRKVRTSLPEMFVSMAMINIQMIDIEYVCLFIAKLQIEPESGGLYIQVVVACRPRSGQEQTCLRPDQTRPEKRKVGKQDTIEDLPITMVDLPNTMVDLSNSMVDIPNNMVDLPNTMVDLALQECRNVGWQECMNVGMNECRNLGIWECRGIVCVD